MNDGGEQQVGLRLRAMEALLGRKATADQASSVRSDLDAVRAYWTGLKGDRPIALRRDIDPMQIGAMLNRTMILERVAPGVGRIRLAGQLLQGFLGMELRGMPMTMLFAPPARDMIAAHLEAAFAGPAIVDVPLTLPRRLTRKPQAARMLILPLADQAGSVSRALVVIAAQGDFPVQSPVRFDIDPKGAVRCAVQRTPTDTPAEPRRRDPLPPLSVSRPIDMSNDSLPEPPRMRRRVVRDQLPSRPMLEVIPGALRVRGLPDDKPPSLHLVVSND